VVEEEFGADDFRCAMNELLELKQTPTVEEYTTQFQNKQFDITMHNPNYDEMFFTPQYVMGLKDEIRSNVEPHMPTTVQKASILAKIQQKFLERNKSKYNRAAQPFRQYAQAKHDNKIQAPSSTLWKDRQLRDYGKANGLCYSCGDKFVPGHVEVYTKRNKPQAHAMVVNDLDRELSDEVLNDMAIEDQLQEEFGKLSLNAISRQDHTNCIKLKTRIKDKVMLILVDSGSTHSFISSHFVQLANLSTIPIPPKKVKLANEEWIVNDKMLPQLECYCQGQTFATDMVVLDMNPYDAILGFDWLQAHNPMECD
jgi:hypothetical protein